MKIQIHEAVKDYIRGELLITRSLLNICQEEMAHRLLMSTRAYVSLEGGKSCCSLITMLLFLSRCCVDQQAFLEGLLAIMDSAESNIR
ncbi:MAG: hypothetical protein LJU34_01445 [Oscillospiraceae bacterium]|nr:hypothetical protein [Oscillospiraceae bacterium]